MIIFGELTNLLIVSELPSMPNDSTPEGPQT